MLTVFGSTALDTIRTPKKTLKNVLGGAATFAAISASNFVNTGLIAVVGKDLWNDKSMIPKQMGIYMVLNTEPNVDFINPGVGGFFKGKDPNVDILQLKEKFVDATVVYIGKAGGTSSKATLFSRLGQYLSFGQTKNIGHYGGRYIWQLKNHDPYDMPPNLQLI